MFTSAQKRLILPFFNPKDRESELEESAVFAFAEFNRNRGGGLLNRQSQETLRFISKIGYPLWVIPKNSQALVFDGLNCHSHTVSYGEVQSASTFIDNLLACQAPREIYFAFLSDNVDYFQNTTKTKQFLFEGLIGNHEFREEFAIYRKEASELTSSIPLLLPLLEEQTINAKLSELEKLLALFIEDKTKLLECLRSIKKTTSQFVTEIDYDVTATKEEADAKIKAQQEFINPQIAKLQKYYSSKIKEVTASFDKEFEDLKKLNIKTEKFISSTESDIKCYGKNAKAAGKKGHQIYEKRWKEKIKQAEKELSGLQKELKNIENNTNKLKKQKVANISKLTLELDAEVKLVREPINQLEVARDAKIFAYKQESNRLCALEKQIIEGIDRNMRLREDITVGFDDLGIGDQQSKGSSLVYLQFYAICYESGLARRYILIPPSGLGELDFSAKLRGAFGVSKGRDLLVPRFKSIEAIVSKAQELTEENSAFETQLWSLGERNNLLRNPVFCINARTGLSTLKQLGWLSERGASELVSQLTA
jgi:uncharacterized protein YacL (UPF0231 family)